MGAHSQIKLAHVLKLRKRSQAALARALEITPQAVSKWIVGKACPTAAVALRMELVLGAKVDFRKLAMGSLRFEVTHDQSA